MRTVPRQSTRGKLSGEMSLRSLLTTSNFEPPQNGESVATTIAPDPSGYNMPELTDMNNYTNTDRWTSVMTPHDSERSQEDAYEMAEAEYLRDLIMEPMFLDSSIF